jgi:hypothetical protein
VYGTSVSAAWFEPWTARPPPYSIVSDVYFDDMAALQNALASPEM